MGKKLYIVLFLLIILLCRTAAVHYSGSFPPLPATITGPESVCEGTGGHVYTTESGMTNYVWTVSSGGAITSGSGTDAITVTWNTAGPQTVEVNYTEATAPGLLNVTVNPSLAVGVSIVASANPVCEGTSVTFTATPINGGTSPTYQWKVNGISVGASSPIFTYTPSNGNVIWCELTSNATCATGNPATSNSITMTVNPNLPVNITIAASANPVCSGTSVTFTATPVNGGSSPVYQWKVNGVNAGSNSPTFSYTPVSGDVVTCILTSSEACTSGNPATSNPVVMTVSPILPVSVAIAASANPVCEGTGVLFTATASNGGSSPVYQWKVNGVNTGSNSPTFLYVPVNGDVVTCQLTSSATCTSGNPATSNAITMTVNPNLPVSITISVSSNPVCQGTSVTFTATPVNGGSGPTYQWVVNGFNVGANSPTYSYTPSNGDQISCYLQSNETCTTGNPALSNQITMTVNPNFPVSVFIVASSNPVCQGNAVTYTATPTNGGSSPAYQWQVNGINAGTNNPVYIYSPVNGDLVTCILTSSATCPTGNPATSNPITMSVSPILPVSVSIAPSANPVCQGSSVTITATPVNGGSFPSYQWKVNGINVGTNSSTYTFVPTSGDVVTCVLTSNANCTTGNPATSNEVTMLVNTSIPVSVSIAASSNPACQSQSVIYTATPVNGGVSPAYQWTVNGINVGTNSNTYTFAPSNGDIIACLLTSSLTCATGNPASSNTITMTVNPNLPVSVSITASTNPVCPGNTVTFTATPVNGGSSPSYQWKVNGINAGANLSMFSYIPLNGDIVTCQLTSSLACVSGNPATSNQVIMTVSTNLPVTISISASNNFVCEGTPITFTATSANGGPSPFYQWKVNGVNVGSNSPVYTYTPANGDVVTCQLTSSLSCASGNPATSNAITMTVYSNAPVSITITASENPACEGNAVLFTAVPVNGGSNPVYQWKVNGVNAGTNSSTFSYVPVNGDIITCILTSNALCATGSPATSNAITMTMLPNLAAGVTITASANPVCEGTQVTYTATPVNGGSSPVYQWNVNGVNVGTNSSTYTYTPANGDIITCQITSSYQCATGNPATSNAITMIVNPNLAVSNLITASANPVCEGTLVTYTATPTNGGSTPVYQWQVNGINVGTNSSTYSYIPADGDVVTCILTSNATCTTGNPATSNTITMTVLPYLTAGVTISASENPVCEGTLVTYTATPVNGGTNPFYQWQVNGINVGTNSSTYSYVPLDGDEIGCILTSDYLCAIGNPAKSNTITMVVQPNLAVSVWITASANPVCEGTPVIFTAIPTNGGSTPVYQWMVNGTNAGFNSSTFIYTPTDGDVITVSLTSNASCATGNPAISNAITMTVLPNLPVSVTITASSNPSCEGDVVLFLATPVNGGSSPIYQWQVNGVNAGSNSPLFSYVPVSGDIISCQLTSSEFCATGNPASSNLITMVVLPNLPAGVTIVASDNPVCEGSQVTYTATPTNGGSNPVYQWQVNGSNAGTNSTTFTYTPVDGDLIVCIMTSDYQCATGNPVTSNVITMTVYPYLTVGITISASANPVCEGTLVTYTATPVNGGASPSFTWRVNGTIVGSSSPTYSYIPSDGDMISCQLSSSVFCPVGDPATSNTITMAVLPYLPAGVDITASDNPVCEGTQVTFTATHVNGGTNPTFQWQVNGTNTGTNNSTFTYTPADGDLVVCIMTSDYFCATGNPATSNTIFMTVLPYLPVSLSITVSENPVCEGNPVVFTANPTNGGTTPVYQWMVNGGNAGTNSTSFSYSPVDGDVVTCLLTSNETCTTGNPALSNSITMVVLPNLTVDITITASSNPSCQGDPVLFTATPVNGGSAPVYQWQVNGVNTGTNNPSFSYAPTDGDIVTCLLTSNEPCPVGNPATSNAISMTIQPYLAAGVTIIASSNPVCTGTSVEFTATPINGGTNPVYQWKINGVDAGTNSTQFFYAPSDGDIITCQMTSDYLCPVTNPVLSNEITMTVLPLPYIALNICVTITTRDAKPFLLRGGIPGGGVYSGSGVQDSMFYPALVPVTQDSSVVTYTYSNVNNCDSSASQTIWIYPSQPFSCGLTLTDIRDNQVYPTVQIGSQCWMAENLNAGNFIPSSSQQRDNCILEKYCYADNSTNCIQYGGLYQWDELMQYSGEEGIQGVCPPAWHIPTEAEWQALFDLYLGNAFAGDPLKTSGSSGFNTLFTGARFINKSWSFLDFATMLWSSTSHGVNKGWAHGLNTYNHSVSYYPSSISNALSIRCIKD
ncbi:MAG: FISUMP domain-containing protein [Bacteroidota bacterium]